MSTRSWSTTAADNNAAPPNGWPEGQAPSSVNNVGRQMMADIRETLEALPFFDYGNTPTRVDADTFTVATDLTARYVAGLSVKLVGASTEYGTITSSSYSAPDTTVNISGTVPTSLVTVSIGLPSSTTSPVRTAAEIAASVTPTNYAYQAGDSRRMSITNDSTTDWTSAFQALLNGAAGSFTVHVYKTQASGYIKLTSRIDWPANCIVELHDGVELRHTTTTAGSNFIGGATKLGYEVIGDNFRLQGKGTVRGPSVGTYVANEIGIYMLGTSTSVRKSGLYIGPEIEMHSWGYCAVIPMFTDKVRILGAHIHDCGYIGVLPMSSNDGKVLSCTIGAMTPGTGGEMHGVSLSSNSGGTLANNPFCRDWEIAFNTVYDMLSWTGIDAHGAYQTNVHNNNIFNCRRAIQIASSSGGFIDYAGEGNSVSFNNITTKKRDGSATSIVGSLIDGITVNGGAIDEHRGVRVIGNDIDGCGDTSGTDSCSITAVRVKGAVIQGNTIRNWKGCGIYTALGDGTMADNTFGPVLNATASRCIRLDTASRAWNVTSNKLELNGGTAPAEGLRITGIVARHIVEDNNFDAATTPYIGTIQTLSGSGAVDLLTKETRITTTGSAAALTLANGTEGQEKFLVMTTDGGGDGTLTPANLINGTTVTFNDVGDTAFLKFIGGEWAFMGGTATLA